MALVEFHDWEPEQAARLKLLFKRGRYYRGIKRPKGYRQRKSGTCFYNAQDLAVCNRGRYVEGVAYARTSTNGWIGMHHAWITLDGETAIDVTYPDAEAHNYFGIEFPTSEIAERWCSTGQIGSFLKLGGGYVLLTPPDFRKNARLHANSKS